MLIDSCMWITWCYGWSPLVVIYQNDKPPWDFSFIVHWPSNHEWMNAVSVWWRGEVSSHAILEAFKPDDKWTWEGVNNMISCHKTRHQNLKNVRTCFRYWLKPEWLAVEEDSSPSKQTSSDVIALWSPSHDCGVQPQSPAAAEISHFVSSEGQAACA